MENQLVMLIIAICVLVALLFAIPKNEKLGAFVPFTAQSSVDCSKFPDSPACKSPPPVNPVSTNLDTCTPPDGQWSIPGVGAQGRSQLNSPCCRPPNYALANTASVGGQTVEYKTCDDKLDLTDPIQKCVQDCCDNANAEANNYDASWYPMARCACSLWCYNQDVPHFKKYGTAVHYITGDLAEATTSDSGDFIGGAGYDFSGQ